MAKKLMKGNEAFGEAAIKAGADAYFCYPITPQTEVAEYLAKRMPQEGKVFLQAESEVAASNMLFGGAAAGARVFTSSSSPGISLMQEAFSYLSCAQLPVVLLNVMRSGPGLGGILPAQSDYHQSTKGGGHGDYKMIVLAPASIQEMVDQTMGAFYLAEKYGICVMLIADGMLGQMMEPVEFNNLPDYSDLQPKNWATTGAEGRDPNIVKTLFLDPEANDQHNVHLQAKYRQIEKEVREFEEYKVSKKNKVLIVSFGSMARICKTVVDSVAEEGIDIGLFRPITLYPFPDEELKKAAKDVDDILVVEMSAGQMIDDVKLALGHDKKYHFYGRTGGIVPTPVEVYNKLKEII